MRITFLGNFRPEFSSENDWLKTLRIMGHEVATFQEDSTVDSEGLCRSIEKSDLFWFTHTNGWLFHDRTVGWIKSISVPSMMLTLDLYRGLEREADVELPHFFCRYVFTADDPSWLRSRGVNAFLSPPGVLETSAYIAAPDPLHSGFDKIVFVGSRQYHAAWAWRRRLLNYLDETYGTDFVVYQHDSGMRGHALNALYASASVVVGDSCFASPSSPYTSDRLFESLGRGANLVYPAVQVDAIGPEDDSAFDFVHWYKPGNFEDLGAAIDDALGVAENSFRGDWQIDQVRAVRENHTYRSRLEAIFETIAKHEPSIAEALSR